MDIKMKNRAQRRFNAYNKYKNRLKKWMPFYEHWNLKNGVRSWKDFEKEEYSKFLQEYPNHELKQSVEFELRNLGVPIEKIDELKDIVGQKDSVKVKK